MTGRNNGTPHPSWPDHALAQFLGRVVAAVIRLI